MKTVLLDTSFVVNCAESRVDFTSQIKMKGLQPKVLDRVVQELKLLMSRRGKKGAAAKLGLVMISGLPVINAPKTGKTDDILVEKASGMTLIATMDAALKRRLRKKGVSVVVLRQRKYVQVIRV